jgi:hypothetical protein
VVLRGATLNKRITPRSTTRQWRLRAAPASKRYYYAVGAAHLGEEETESCVLSLYLITLTALTALPPFSLLHLLHTLLAVLATYTYCAY